MSEPLSDLFRAMASASRHLSAGEFLFHRQDPAASMYLVEMGHVELLRRQPDGTPLVLQRAGAGDFLAEASLYSTAYHCDAVAVRPTVVQAVPKAALLKAFAENPAFVQA